MKPVNIQPNLFLVSADISSGSSGTGGGFGTSQLAQSGPRGCLVAARPLASHCCRLLHLLARCTCCARYACCANLHPLLLPQLASGMLQACYACCANYACCVHLHFLAMLQLALSTGMVCLLSKLCLLSKSPVLCHCRSLLYVLAKSAWCACCANLHSLVIAAACFIHLDGMPAVQVMVPVPIYIYELLSRFAVSIGKVRLLCACAIVHSLAMVPVIWCHIDKTQPDPKPH